MENTLKINEIFFSVQGESTHAGRACAFVRLMGCPLRCQYCDTEYAFTEGKSKSFDEIFKVLESYNCQLVEVTGGEPLAQKSAIPFMKELVSRGYEVLLETSGAYPIFEVPREVAIIMDVKTPDSKENHRMFWDNMASLKSGLDEVKFVICSKNDFDYMLGICERFHLTERVTVLASPSHNQVKPADLAAWMLESPNSVARLIRMQVQLHKVLWGAEVRGV